MFTKLVRIGRDAETRFTNNGKPVTGFPVVYDIGYGDNKKSQWVDCSYWGEQGQKVAAYLLKGKQVVVTLDDVAIEEYQSQNGNGVKLVARVVKVNLVSDGSQQSTQAPKQQGYAPQRAPQRLPTMAEKEAQQRALQEPSIDFDDDLPF